MRRIWLAALAVAVLGGAAALAEDARRSRETRMPDVTLAGVTWRGDFGAARKEAAATGRPILLLQLFGRLDEEFC